VPSIISSPVIRPARSGKPALPPGPKSNSPLGHLVEVRRDILGFLTRVAAEFGDVAYFRIGHLRIVLLSHPDYVKEVLLTNNRNFVKGRPLKLAKWLLGEGLLTSEGDFHARQSRIVQPSLHSQRLHTYGSVMTDYAVRLSDRWQAGITVDIAHEMARMATAIAGKTMFNWDVDSEVAAGIDNALNDAMALFSRVTIPFAEWLLLLPLPSTFRFYRAKAHFDSTIYRLIKERRATRHDHGDLLSMLLVAQDAEGDGTGMTDRQVRDEALTLFLTALDTVSVALTWTWYLVSQHEDVEARLHAELEQVLGGTPPTVDDLARLPYTRMVVSEALRLFPPNYAIAREALEAFSVGGYAVPAGTLILMSPYVIQRDARFFRDPSRFDPERWNPELAEKPQKFAYFPFGGGPRGCIGQSYAVQEATLVVATLAQRWRMRLAPGHPVGFRPLINLRPSHGMRMVLERRPRPGDREEES
jgi:cytochrome P450